VTKSTGVGRIGRPRWKTPTLPNGHLAVLAGRGLSDAEIGALYGCNKNTVRSRRVRAAVAAGVKPGGQRGRQKRWNEGAAV
jgi:hypothetical protein